MKYILDFDHTLFDTERFAQTVREDNRADLLITPTIWQFYAVRDFLYDDVLPWMQSKTPASLHILTAMTPEYGPLSCAFQKEKLHSGKFEEFVSDITFMVGEKGETAAEIASQFPPHETTVFVDDRIEQCLSVQQALPQAVCCLMVRDASQIGDVKTVRGIHVVHTLAEVDGIIEKL